METGNKRLKDEKGKDVLPEVTGYQLTDDSGNGYRSNSCLLPYYHYVRLQEAKGFDPNTFYPCVIRVANNSTQFRPARVNIFCDYRGSDAPVKWSTHANSRLISCNVEFEAVISRWGGNNNYSFVKRAYFRYCDTMNFCVSKIGQVMELDFIYFYLRGGASYRVTVDAGYQYNLAVYPDGFKYTLSGTDRTLPTLPYTDKSLTAPAVSSRLTDTEKARLEAIPGLLATLPATPPANSDTAIRAYLGVSSFADLKKKFAAGFFFRTKYRQDGDNTVTLYPSTLTSDSDTLRWAGHSELSHSIVVLSVYQAGGQFSSVTYSEAQKPARLAVLGTAAPGQTHDAIKAYLGVEGVDELKEAFANGSFFQSKYKQAGGQVLLYPSTQTGSGPSLYWAGYSEYSHSILLMRVGISGGEFKALVYSEIDLAHVANAPQDIGWINLMDLAASNTSFNKYTAEGEYIFCNANYYGGNRLSVHVDQKTSDIVQTLSMFTGDGTRRVYAVRRRTGTTWGSWNKTS